MKRILIASSAGDSERAVADRIRMAVIEISVKYGGHGLTPTVCSTPEQVSAEMQSGEVHSVLLLEGYTLELAEALKVKHPRVKVILMPTAMSGIEVVVMPVGCANMAILERLLFIGQ